VNAQLRKDLQELFTADSQFDREIVDPRTVHCILLMILRCISADTRGEFRIPHSHRLNGVPAETASELTGRGAFQQRDAASPREPAHLFLGSRAAILGDHDQADLPAL
jgi:hypothetical protein